VVGQHQGKILVRVGPHDLPGGDESVALLDADHARPVDHMLDGSDQARCHQETRADVGPATGVRLDPNHTATHATDDVGQ
jgi:hypothetical protein